MIIVLVIAKLLAAVQRNPANWRRKTGTGSTITWRSANCVLTVLPAQVRFLRWKTLWRKAITERYMVLFEQQFLSFLVHCFHPERSRYLSLRKHPFILALRRWWRFERRNDVPRCFSRWFSWTFELMDEILRCYLQNESSVSSTFLWCCSLCCTRWF